MRKMGRVILDRAGDLRRSVFYRFDVSMDDGTCGQEPGDGWVIAPRTPTDRELQFRNQETYMRAEMTGGWESRVEFRDCPADPMHVTHRYCTKHEAESTGGKRISHFVPADTLQDIILSDALNTGLSRLPIRGARIDPLDIVDHFS